MATSHSPRPAPATDRSPATTESEAAFRIRGLRTGFGPRTVIEALDLDLPAGRSSVVLGPGGSGKSTLLRILGEGVDPPLPAADPGFVRHPEEGGGDLWREGQLERRIGSLGRMVQTPDGGTATLEQVLAARFRELSAAAQVDAAQTDDAVTVRRPARNRLDELWPEAVPFLKPHWETPFADLDRDVAQLASFVVTLAGESPCLLLDEPTAEQDGELEALVLRRLQRLRSEGRTLVTVTHNLRVARAVADYVVLLIQGRCVEAADAETFFRSPRNPRTEYFVRMGC